MEVTPVDLGGHDKGTDVTSEISNDQVEFKDEVGGEQAPETRDNDDGQRPEVLPQSQEPTVEEDAAHAPTKKLSEQEQMSSAHEPESAPVTEPQAESDQLGNDELERTKPIEQNEAVLELAVTDTKSDDTESKDEEDYDPEVAFRHEVDLPDKPTLEVLKGNCRNEPEFSQDDEDDYDPEVSLNEKSTRPSNIPPKPPVGLPPKPPVSATNNSVSSQSKTKLQEAYEAIMQSDLVKDPNFANLPQAEQMKLIVEKLNSKNLHLTSSNPNANFDQVYSYNKPFKNLKNPIPLVPVNEYCRRPNITAPMTQEEENAYHEFIQREAYYMNLQNWDEFPDKLRLFIGNLPANTISKQDLFRIFSQYGEVIQIAIKAGYGFAQFRTAEACLECIKGETNVPLHNKIMRLDASKPQKSRRGGKPEVNNPNMGARGRERTEEDPEQEPKRIKPNVDCQVYITGKSSVFFIRKVKKAFANAQITINTEDVTYKEIQDVISEAAYSGVLGTCVINELKVDVQTFESSPDGGIKFDEYADIEPEVAAEILAKAKLKKYGTDMPPYYPQSSGYSEHSPGSTHVQPEDNYHNHGGAQYNHQNRRGPRGRRGRGYQGWDNVEPQPYRQPPPQFGLSYGEPAPSYNQPQNRYGHLGYEKYNTPTQYDTYQPPQPQQPKQPNQQQLVQQLQNLDPQSMQNMLSMMQQNQQPQQPQPYGQPAPQQQYGGYGGQYGTNTSNAPTNQVNALLSNLQQNPPGNASQNQSQGSTQSFMETLARLSRK